jgi:alkylation response protein AidB-like acyl-CoA dehydrogenase
MTFYTTPHPHYDFILNHVLKLSEQLPDFDAETTRFMLESAGNFAEKELAPLYNQMHYKHDHVNFQIEDNADFGAVTLPEGFKEAYELFVETGLQGIVADPGYGEAGLKQPHIVGAVIDEILHSANGDFTLIPTLTHSAYLGIYSHATEAQKQRYLPNLASGKSSGIMAMTEGGAGSDLSNVKTTATAQTDGSYRLNGQKIYISGGDNHYTSVDDGGNIIHVVLAKIKDAETGEFDDRLSMFIVPKIREENGARQANSVGPIGTERKIGMPGSATCTIFYKEAWGELIGERGKGIATMFAVMNEARNHVARQAIGCMEAAYQKALHFASDPETGRRMGRSLEGPVDPDKEGDLIIVHPAVRKLLLTMRSQIAGARMLQLDTALQMDLAALGDENAKNWVSLMTNIVKAHCTELGSEVTDAAIQIFGGLGYVEETGIACHYKDVRVTRIYEGTNQIQALTLFRQLPHLEVFYERVEAVIKEAKTDHPKQSTELSEALANCRKLSDHFGQKDISGFAIGADEFLKLIAITALAHYHLKAKCAAKNAELPPEITQEATSNCNFYFAHMLVEHDALARRALESGGLLSGI